MYASTERKPEVKVDRSIPESGYLYELLTEKRDQLQAVKPKAMVAVAGRSF